MGAGAVAMGYETNRRKHKKERRMRRMNRRHARFYDEYGGPDYDSPLYEEYYDPRPPPISRRNPNDISFFDEEIEENGNYAMRGKMMRYAKHKMNNLYGFQSSVWDLEGFLY